MSEDYGGVAHHLKSQAEAQLQTNAPRAAAIAGLAQVSALLAIHQSLEMLIEEIRISRDRGVGIYMQNEDFGVIRVAGLDRNG